MFLVHPIAPASACCLAEDTYGLVDNDRPGLPVVAYLPAPVCYEVAYRLNVLHGGHGDYRRYWAMQLDSESQNDFLARHARGEAHAVIGKHDSGEGWLGFALGRFSAYIVLAALQAGPPPRPEE